MAAVVAVSGATGTTIKVLAESVNSPGFSKATLGRGINVRRSFCAWAVIGINNANTNHVRMFILVVIWGIWGIWDMGIWGRGRARGPAPTGGEPGGTGGLICFAVV